MAIPKLLASNLGAIILCNAYGLVHSDLLDDDDKRLVLLGLRRAARALTLPYRPEDLVDALRAELKPVMSRLQVAGLEAPHPDLTFLAVRGWADVKDMLEEIYKAKKPDKAIEGMIYRPVPSDDFYVRVAHTLNLRAAGRVPVTLSGPRNIFYLTSTRRLDAIAPGYQRLPYSERAHKVRDILGLGHLSADEEGRPYPLFAFRSMLPAHALQRGARIARPTTVDGFDNTRFRQAWPAAELDPGGGGMTVRLDVPFGPGSSEFVATQIPLRGHFVCEYLGSVSTPAAGSDEAFVRYLDTFHGGILPTIPALLETWKPR